MLSPSPDEVRTAIDRLHKSRFFRGLKRRRLIDFLVEECLAGRGNKLTVRYIGESLGDESLTFEADSDRWGYPKTRANLVHVRTNLRKYFETEGYRDRVILKINQGSYAPVIAYNPVSTAIPDLEPTIESLILRAKTAIDARTVRGALRAVEYYAQIPNSDNPRQEANLCFIPMAVASSLPAMAPGVRPAVEAAIARIKASGVEPWECMFAEASIEAFHRHNWKKSLELFELAVEKSQGEAKYFWWYTALLASTGRMQDAIEILDAEVRHFSRTSIAVRTDLGLLLTMAGRFAEAEELLVASLDFARESNARITYSLLVLFEAQDRMEDAAALVVRSFDATDEDVAKSVLAAFESLRAGEPPSSSLMERAFTVTDLHVLSGGMFALLMARINETAFASELVGYLLRTKAKYPEASSIEIAIGMVALRQFDDAVGWLRRAAFEESDPFAMWFHILPALRHLRDHRGFRELLKTLKLPLQRLR